MGKAARSTLEKKSLNACEHCAPVVAYYGLSLDGNIGEHTGFPGSTKAEALKEFRKERKRNPSASFLLITLKRLTNGG